MGEAETRSCECAEGTSGAGKSGFQNHWEDECHVPGSSFGTSILQVPSDGSVINPDTTRHTRHNVPCQLRLKRSSSGGYFILEQWNSKSLLMQQPKLMIESDASFRGWGASTQVVQTGGPWSQTKQQLHINCLEIQVASLAGEIFCQIMQRYDNSNTHGQCHSSVNHTGGHSNQTGQGLLDVVLVEKLDTTSTTPPWVENVRVDRDCQRVQGNERQIRLDAPPSDFFKRSRVRWVQ